MADFSKAFLYILPNEGGFSNHEADKGGPTNLGITLKLAKQYGIVTVERLKALTEEEAARIYWHEFWRFDGLLEQRVATKIFDVAVNCGLGTAVRLAQITAVEFGAKIKADGGYGPKTELAINEIDPERFLYEFCKNLEGRYKNIVDRDPSQAVFLKGWLNRARRLPV